MVRRGKGAVMFLVFSIREITTSQLALTRVWVEKIGLSRVKIGVWVE